MVGELLVATYAFLALILGIKIFTKTLSWFAETDRAVFPIPTASIIGWGFVAFISALLLEFAVMYPLWGSSAVLLVLAIAVGPIEEGAKLLPFLLSKNRDVMARWRLTLKVALVFGVIEAALYFMILLARGNLIGGLLRVIILMFHVAWTAIALEDALKGSLLRGYLRASLLHGLYDTPVLLLYFGGGIAGLLALGGIWAVVYLYRSIDEAFGFAMSYEKGLIAKRRERIKTLNSEGWRIQETGEEIEREIVQGNLNENDGRGDFTSSL